VPAFLNASWVNYILSVVYKIGNVSSMIISKSVWFSSNNCEVFWTYNLSVTKHYKEISKTEGVTCLPYKIFPKICRKFRLNFGKIS